MNVAVVAWARSARVKSVCGGGGNGRIARACVSCDGDSDGDRELDEKRDRETYTDTHTKGEAG